MKKLLDKPYKTHLVSIGLCIATLMLINFDGSLQQTTSEISIITSTTKEVESSAKEVESSTKDEQSLIREPVKKVVKPQQETKPVIISRGAVPSKPLSQRDVINKYVKEICSKYNIDPYLIMSMIESESSYNPKCTTGNCLGLMQVSRIWHSDRAHKLGVKDFYDPYGNILLGVDYISELLKTYKDPRLVLMLYNMDHKTAFTMYRNGQVSTYARTVLSRAEQYRKGE